MSSDLLGISITGIRVSQSALRTAGHNIANAATEGYSRQQVSTTANAAFGGNGGYVGSGASVGSVDRLVNQFVTEQLRIDTSLSKDLEVFHQQITQLDNLLSDESTGLASALQAFFASLQSSSDDPTSIPGRQLVISEAENLSDRFNSINARLNVIEDSTDDFLEASVAQVNALSQDIANLNLKISDAQGAANGEPNDLLDQRDEALRELSELISIQTFSQGNGQVNVLTGAGQSLVIGTDSLSLSLVASENDAGTKDLVYNSARGAEIITDLVSGGEIGGLIRFRDELMRDAYNSLGRVAVAVADNMNQTHQSGLNLVNEFGGLFFYDVNGTEVARSRVLAGANNASEGQLAVYFNDTSSIGTSDYNMTIQNDGLFRVTRDSDGEEVASGLFPGGFPFTVSFDGLDVVFEGGVFTDGDSYKLQPVRNASYDFGRVIENPEEIAYASPVLADASLGNTGNGKIAPGEILDLEDSDGNPLPLLANSGEMDPPLKVQFITPTYYEVLDNSDPGNPVQLDPPIRNQSFLPGVSNSVFSTDPGATMVTTQGDMIGMPEGRLAVTQASIVVDGGIAPDYAVSDFSGAANQFAFDLEISNTPNGVNDGTHTITIDSPAIVDDTTLLFEINSQISTTGARAYIADDGSLAFRLNDSGYGDLTLNNYNADPDGAGAAPAGQANNLLGFDIEGTTYTTIGDADGVSGDGALTNGYPAELITITQPVEIVGTAAETTNIFTTLNASAKEIASQLSNVSGVQANASNYIEISDLNLTQSTPLQLTLNGQDLLQYSTDSITGELTLSASVPDPASDPDAFNQHVANQINANSTLQNLGIFATNGQDPLTGELELRIYSTQGDDFEFSLTAQEGESVDIGDGEKTNVTLNGAGNSVSSSMVVGGRLDVSLADGVTLSTIPPVSMLFGDTQAQDFAKSSYLGIQTAISGSPDAGDSFTLDINLDGASDNRNALNLINLESANTLDNGISTFSDGYGALIESIGIKTSAADINRSAAEEVLAQTTTLRNSKSGVNLDEEAADLIRYEQLFAANSQVISVARELFDRLLSTF